MTSTAFRDCLPLAIGIHKEIAKRLPDIPWTQLRAALQIHTTSFDYLKVLSGARDRFDLDGNRVGEVTEEQRQLALTSLRGQIKQQGALRRAEAATKESREKLLRLAEKFNRR